MIFRSGKISLDLESEAGVVILEHDDSEGHGLAIYVPRGWAPDLEQLTLWCCRFLGMVAEDQPTFTVVSDPVPRDRSEKEFAVGLRGSIADIAKGAVLASIPVASR